MIKILALFFSLSALTTIPNHDNVKELRTLFYSASEDSKSSTTLFDKLSNINDNSAPILQGYKGMSYLLEAKHSYNIYKKYSYFSKGADILDVAIEKGPNNRELRFLRYSVQNNAPQFLGYYEEMANDKKIILTNLANESDDDLKKKIIEYLQPE